MHVIMYKFFVFMPTVQKKYQQCLVDIDRRSDNLLL
jgi:hypothetical protein